MLLRQERFKQELLRVKLRSAGGGSEPYDWFPNNSSSEAEQPHLTATFRVHTWEERDEFCDQLVGLLDDLEFSDVLFVVGEEEEWIYAHRNVLSDACDYFKNMFLGGMRETHETIIRIPSVSPSTFRLLLEYCYFGDIFGPDVQLSFGELFDLQSLADQYFVTDLQKRCEKVLREAIDATNVFEILELARGYGASEIEQACLRFMAKELRTLLPTPSYRGLDKDILLKVMDVWMESNPAQPPNQQPSRGPLPPQRPNFFDSLVQHLD